MHWGSPFGGRGCAWAPVVICALLWALPAGAQADGRVFGFGPRIGVSLNPHQLVLGGQAHFDQILPQSRLVAPIVEVGLGDNQTTLGLGGQITAPVFGAFDGWQAHVGGELALQRIFPDEGAADSFLGMMGVLLIERPVSEDTRFGLELKFEIIDAPGIEVLTTWTFGS